MFSFFCQYILHIVPFKDVDEPGSDCEEDLHFQAFLDTADRRKCLDAEVGPFVGARWDTAVNAWDLLPILLAFRSAWSQPVGKVKALCQLLTGLCDQTGEWQALAEMMAFPPFPRLFLTRVFDLLVSTCYQLRPLPLVERCTAVFAVTAPLTAPVLYLNPWKESPRE